MLIKEGISFNILCDTRLVSFSPALPEYISSTFNPIADFVLAGYTLESIELESSAMHFEAGFGSENIGSFVSIEYGGILQILLRSEHLRDDGSRDIALFTNVSHPFFSPFKDSEIVESSAELDELAHSRLAFGGAKSGAKDVAKHRARKNNKNS